MGAAVLITLGVLFLLDEFHVFPFNDSFPVLLIVIGLVLYMGRSASIEGHIERYATTSPVPPLPPVGNQPGPEVNQ